MPLRRRQFEFGDEPLPEDLFDEPARSEPLGEPAADPLDDNASLSPATIAPFEPTAVEADAADRAIDSVQDQPVWADGEITEALPAAGAIADRGDSRPRPRTTRSLARPRVLATGAVGAALAAVLAVGGLGGAEPDLDPRTSADRPPTPVPATPPRPAAPRPARPRPRPKRRRARRVAQRPHRQTAPSPAAPVVAPPPAPPADAPVSGPAPTAAPVAPQPPAAAREFGIEP